MDGQTDGRTESIIEYSALHSCNDGITFTEEESSS